jgi:gas vesicle protein
MKGFLTGMSIGAVVMLFFAPQSGKNTRRYFGRRIERGADKVQEIRDKSRVIVKRANKALARAADAGRSMAAAVL